MAHLHIWFVCIAIEWGMCRHTGFSQIIDEIRNIGIGGFTTWKQKFSNNKK